MNTYIFLAIFIAIFAVLYRLRGGAISDYTKKYFEQRLGTHLTRLICWVLPITLLFAVYVGYDWLFLIAIFICAWFSIAMGHGTFQDNGHSPQTFNWLAPWMPAYMITDSRAYRIMIDMLGMSSVHLMRGVILLLPIFFFMPMMLNLQILMFFIPLVLIGPAYYLGWRTKLDLPQLQAESTEWGELYTGGLWGVAFWGLLL